MLTKKKKLSKKAIKEDKLVTFYYKAYGYFDENKSRILLYGGALVILVLAVFYYYRTKSEDNVKAGVELAKVMDLYDSGSFLEAIEGSASNNTVGLKQIVDSYGSTENGETAKIYLADAYNMLGKPQDAFKYYQSYDGDIPIFRAAALAGEADYYVSQNKRDKAASLYEKASTISKVNVLNSNYLLKAGVNYLRAGDTKQAKETFNRIKKNYPDSDASRQVEKYLAEARVG